MGKKVILHLCADLGSDSLFYQLSDDYEVIMIGEEIGVENYNPPANVHGIIANPVCTELSTANGFHKENDLKKGMFLVDHCFRIIEVAKPVWWAMENPANGRLKELIYTRPGRPKPALAFLHKSAVNLIPEFQWAKDMIKCDADIRSMCSQGFAKAFFESNE